jgi:anaerobic dimethyl sulfoxide reductase subunit A
MGEEERVITTSCAHNCGGRCLLRVHVQNGRVIRVSTDNAEEKDGYNQLRACMRGRSYRERLYHPDRLQYPLKRTGKRGEGKFSRISWNEATGLIAAELKRITEKYGPGSRYINYSSGIAGVLNEREFFRRLLTIYGGGYLNYYSSYSSACTRIATGYTFGTSNTGSSRDNWQYSKLIILWGHNPAETIFGTNTTYYLKLAKEKGAKIIVIDPRYSDSAVALADQWIPLLPTTDNALMDAMIHVMITEKLYDSDFVDKFCLGFDESRMPPGVPPGNSLTAYILGQCDRIEKTPAWAEEITRVPAAVIQQLARDYATAKPAALLQGLGPQRHAYGEQPARGATVLAAITGNVGIRGGWASGTGSYSGVKLAGVPYHNNVKASISVFTWPEAIMCGQEMGPAHGLRNAGSLDSGIKFMASLAGNCLLNQHSDINKTAEILGDESKCEFILVSDEFMTASARFADILLPSTNFLERLDIVLPWEYGDYVVFQNKAVEPHYERRTGYDWMLEVAAKLGVREEFSQGKSYEDWARYIVAETRKIDSQFPSYEEFKERGIYEKAKTGPQVAFREQIENNHPFLTPTGKIEIFSPRLFAMNNPVEIPAIPKYIPSWEGPADSLREKFPLQLFGWHSKRSTHSTMANSDWLAEIEPQSLWINPDDAGPRALSSGDRARVFNGRGELEITVRVTSRIMPGVVGMPQGAWYNPDHEGVDHGGCINTVTKYHPTPLARGNPQHTNLVQVKKMESR